MFKIVQLSPEQETPYDLLLMADPSIEMVDHYLERGQCFLAMRDDRAIGAYVIMNTKLFTWEIANLALIPEMRGRGIGKELLLDAIKRVRTLGGRIVEIGTGNASFDQLALYQKCGFRITGVYPDFFLKNYKEPIIENGIRNLDMVRLSIDFNS